MAKKSKNKSARNKALRYRGTKCLNCGQPLDKSDRYCPYCSQKNSNKQLSAKDYFSEFIGSILVYDSRLRYTIRELLFKPGRVSENYMAGQRLKYANPFRFFLSVSIIYFLLKSLLPSVSSSNEINDLSIMFDEEQTSTNLTTKEIPANLYIFETRGDTLRAKEIGITQYFSEAYLDTLSFFESQARRASLYLEYYQEHPQQSPKEGLAALSHKSNAKNRWLYTRAITAQKVFGNPKDFRDYITSKIPFFLFFFAPVFALFFHLFYLKTKYNYIEHLIFLFHLFSFYYLARIPIILLNTVFKVEIFDALFALIGMPLYFYLALRKFYKQSHWLTAIKFIFLSFVFGVSFLIGIIVFILGSAAVY